MFLDKQAKGLKGEALAEEFLQAMGFEVWAKNWRHPDFRIQVDLVVRQSGKAYIVEVKNQRWTGSGFEQLMSWKQRERLLNYTRKLHLMNYRDHTWAFMWVWVNRGKCQIMEKIIF
jgi:Holliday junction resolvase-like predicted endonuclease